MVVGGRRERSLGRIVLDVDNCVSQGVCVNIRGVLIPSSDDVYFPMKIILSVCQKKGVDCAGLSISSFGSQIKRVHVVVAAEIVCLS